MTNDTNTRFTLRDVKKVPGTRFRYDNWVRSLGIEQPAIYDLDSREVVIELPWQLIGWSDALGSGLMHGREGQIALLFWHQDCEIFGCDEVWQHFGLYDEEERNGQVFVYRKRHKYKG